MAPTVMAPLSLFMLALLWYNAFAEMLPDTVLTLS
jgi:hypothetical protein